MTSTFNFSFFQIYSESFSSEEVRSVSGNLNIDQTLGRDVAFEITYKVPEAPETFLINCPNGTNIHIEAPAEKEITFKYIFDTTLEVC